MLSDPYLIYRTQSGGAESWLDNMGKVLALRAEYEKWKAAQEEKNRELARERLINTAARWATIPYEWRNPEDEKTARELKPLLEKVPVPTPEAIAEDRRTASELRGIFGIPEPEPAVDSGGSTLPVSFNVDRSGQGADRKGAYFDKGRFLQYLYKYDPILATSYKKMFDAEEAEAQKTHFDILGKLSGLSRDEADILLKKTQAANYADIMRDRGLADERWLKEWEKKEALEEKKAQWAEKRARIMADAQRARQEAEIEARERPKKEAALKTARDISRLTEEIVKHSGFALGLDPARIKALGPTKERDFTGAVQQLKELLALNLTIEKINGQGQVSDKERERADRAATRLSLNMRPQDFIKEINVIREAIGATPLKQPVKRGSYKGMDYVIEEIEE